MFINPFMVLKKIFIFCFSSIHRLWFLPLIFLYLFFIIYNSTNRAVSLSILVLIYLDMLLFLRGGGVVYHILPSSQLVFLLLFLLYLSLCTFPCRRHISFFYYIFVSVFILLLFVLLKILFNLWFFIWWVICNSN